MSSKKKSTFYSAVTDVLFTESCGIEGKKLAEVYSKYMGTLALDVEVYTLLCMIWLVTANMVTSKPLPYSTCIPMHGSATSSVNYLPENNLCDSVFRGCLTTA